MRALIVLIFIPLYCASCCESILFVFETNENQSIAAPVLLFPLRAKRQLRLILFYLYTRMQVTEFILMRRFHFLSLLLLLLCSPLLLSKRYVCFAIFVFWHLFETNNDNNKMTSLIEYDFVLSLEQCKYLYNNSREKTSTCRHLGGNYWPMFTKEMAPSSTDNRSSSSSSSSGDSNGALEKAMPDEFSSGTSPTHRSPPNFEKSKPLYNQLNSLAKNATTKQTVAYTFANTWSECS